jgi:hypothetical protein
MSKEELERVIHSKALIELKPCCAYEKECLNGLKPCSVYEDGCNDWAGCPCVYYKSESEGENG